MSIADRRSAVDRASEPVDHTPEQKPADANGGGGLFRVNLIAGADAAGLPEQHDDRVIFRKPDDFSGYGIRPQAPARMNRNHRADRNGQVFDQDRHPFHRGDASLHEKRLRPPNGRNRVREGGHGCAPSPALGDGLLDEAEGRIVSMIRSSWTAMPASISPPAVRATHSPR